MIDWTQYAVGGATRPDSFTGMNGDFSAALARIFAEAPDEVRSGLRVSSGYRSEDRQAQLWADAVKKYGSEAEARKWVAPPGRSQHNHGNAADLKYLSTAAKEWVRANASRYGLAFPLSNEDWHVELAAARSGAPSGGSNALAGAAYAQPPANALAAPQPTLQYNALQLTPYRMT